MNSLDVLIAAAEAVLDDLYVNHELDCALYASQPCNCAEKAAEDRVSNLRAAIAAARAERDHKEPQP